MINVTPTDMQNKAIIEIKDWLLNSSEKRFVLGGYAGTGKSTIAGILEKELNNVVYVAYTGKAASVLREKGCNATTIHSAIYELVKEDETGQPIFKLRHGSDIGRSDLVICDEYSMLPKDIIDDLESLCPKVLYLGDPFQLPPVSGICNLNPDFILTEVHRQALDSNILRYATMVREGKGLSYCKHDDFWFDAFNGIPANEYMNAEKIIVGKNNTRQSWNDRMRFRNGLSGEPQSGDTLICLRNNHEHGIYNGMEAKLLSCKDYGDVYRLKILCDSGEISLDAYKEYFNKTKPKRSQKGIEHFDYGYVITAHKSQGSEWDNILVYNQALGNDRIERQRWLYTAITRAKKRCVLVDI